MPEKKSIHVTIDVEAPTYEQVKAYLLANGWKLGHHTTPEWELEQGVILHEWKKKKDSFYIRIQRNGEIKTDVEELQVQKAIQTVAALDNVAQYYIWLDIILLERPKIETE